MRLASRHLRQVNTALRRGATVEKKTNTRVTFDGEVKPYMTFKGPLVSATGQMDFWHWGKRVLSVDFTRDAITDYGYMGYSTSTSRNICLWIEALRHKKFMEMTVLRSGVCSFEWITYRYDAWRRSYTWRAAMFKRFQARLPWVETLGNGNKWIVGPKYDPALVYQYDVVMPRVSGTFHHWFTGDWDENGVWCERFIDDAARKRFEKREAKRAPKAA